MNTEQGSKLQFFNRRCAFFLQNSDRQLQFSDKVLNIFNFVPKFPQNVLLSDTNFEFLDKSFQTEIFFDKFPTVRNLRGTIVLCFPPQARR